MDLSILMDTNSYFTAEILGLWRTRIGVHEINQKRHVYGVYNHLYFQLRKDPAKFYDYMAMSISSFDLLLQKTEQLLTNSVNVGVREIKPAEKLMVTLR